MKKKILITSGGTQVPIDSVRHIGNMSKGTFGAKIAKAFMAYDGDWSPHVMFLRSAGSVAPFQISHNFLGNLSDPPTAERILQIQIEVEKIARDARRALEINAYREVTYKTFDDYRTMFNGIMESERPDAVVLAAAVSDFLIDAYDGKMTSKYVQTRHFSPAPKIIADIRKKYPNIVLVGFKLLVNSTDDQLIAAAKESIKTNGCTFVVANDLRDIKNAAHRLCIVDAMGNINFHRNDPAFNDNLADIVAAQTMTALRYQ